MSIKRWLRATALLVALLLICAAAVAGGNEESGNVQASDMPGERPAHVSEDGERPEGARPPDGQPAQSPGGMPGEPGTISQGTSATTLETDATISGGSFVSQKADENALRVTNLAQVTLSGIIIQKSEGDTSSTENSDFLRPERGLSGH